MNSQFFVKFLKKKKIPDCPGVYFFQEGKKILYVGRATSLRDRTRSYFSADLIKTRGPITVEMVEKASDIKFQKTESVLEAIIFEANLIKKFQPPYNIKEKDDKSFNYVVITKEDFPRVLTVRGKNLIFGLSAQIPRSYVAGPFPNGGALKEALKYIRKIFPYRDEKCRVGQGRPCFNRHLGLCPGTCTGEISQKEYEKNIKNIRKIFEGQKKSVVEFLEKEMQNFARLEKFEMAGEIKKKIFALNHIRDVAFIKDDADARIFSNNQKERKPFRIEAYDVAHLAGKSARGVMVVMENGELKKEKYRTFIIRKARKGDDVGALREILERRLKHLEWQMPDLAVIDGGQGQLSTAISVIKKYLTDIKIVSVVKDEHHKARAILGNQEDVNKKDVIRMDAEAHRFSIIKHRRALRQSMLTTNQ